MSELDYLVPDESEAPIRAAYRSAVHRAQELESTNLHPFTNEFKLLQADALKQLAASAQQIASAGLFSSNEEIEDVSTAEIPYLNVDFHIARVLERTPIDPSRTSVDNRCGIVQLSARKYLEYLSRLDDYKLIQNANHKSIIDLTLPEGIQGRFNLLAALEQSMKQNPLQKKRQATELKNMERELAKESLRAQSIMLEDEELVRNVLLMRIKYNESLAINAVMDAAHELTVLSRMSVSMGVSPLQERNTPYVPPQLIEGYVEKLQQATGITFDDAHDERMARQDRPAGLSSTRVDTVPSTRLTGPNGGVRQPFTILPAGQASTMSRQDIAANIFGTGQRLPTISMEELVQKELENAVDGRPKPQPAAEDEDSEAAADAETMKARLWDEFTESVAKGSGNTLNLG